MSNKSRQTLKLVDFKKHCNRTNINQCYTQQGSDVMAGASYVQRDLEIKLITRRHAYSQC